jgi:hypothetical protein
MGMYNENHNCRRYWRRVSTELLTTLRCSGFMGIGFFVRYYYYTRLPVGNKFFQQCAAGLLHLYN